jgi:hypothetical protein
MNRIIGFLVVAGVAYLFYALVTGLKAAGF